LLSQPGVGPVTSLAFVLTVGDVSRFPRGKQVASYRGLIPREYSSGGQLWRPRGAQSTARAELHLDNAFVLIEGHPEAQNQRLDCTSQKAVRILD
jgi:transposase